MQMIARLLADLVRFLLLVFHERQNIEALDLSAREIAVDGVLFLGEHFKNSVQSRQRQQFHVAPPAFLICV